MMRKALDVFSTSPLKQSNGPKFMLVSTDMAYLLEMHNWFFYVYQSVILVYYMNDPLVHAIP
jgi:hypothetical protein